VWFLHKTEIMKPENALTQMISLIFSSWIAIMRFFDIYVECSPYINPLNPLRNVRIITANIDPLHSRPHIGKIKRFIMTVWITMTMLWTRMWDSRISSVLTPIAYLHYSYYYDKKKADEEVVKLWFWRLNYLELHFESRHHPIYL